MDVDFRSGAHLFMWSCLKHCKICKKDPKMVQVPLEIVVGICDTFDNNLRIDKEFKREVLELFWLTFLL